MRVVTIYDDEREIIYMLVHMICKGNQQRQTKDEVAKSQRLHIEHMNSHDNKVQTRTFQVDLFYRNVFESACEK